MIRPIFLVLCLAGITFGCFRMCVLETQRRLIKEDLIELSMIKYGLFSVDEWKQIISNVLTKKVEEMHFTGEQKEDMRVKISNFLYKTLDDFENRFYNENSNSIGGLFKSLVAGVTGTFSQMKKDVPIFTEQILDFLGNENNREKIKEFILEKLTEYTDRTFSKIDYSTHNQILYKYQIGDRQETQAGLLEKIAEIHRQERSYAFLVFGLFVTVAIFLVVANNARPVEYLLYISICIVALAAGLFLPMIEIDARIEEMSFSLLGEEVSFHDQVLYYKSKSILEVVQLMLQQPKWDVRLVGGLVLMFSVLFPLSKLIASVVYVFNRNLERFRFIRFMVFRTGKWSMADVMVVAIFMSYIGFSGILTEQLGQIENLTRSLDIVTTNKSSLQLGFYLFTGFVILSLLASHTLQWDKKKE